MDYHQTTERYRKREARSQAIFILWVVLLLGAFWAGWMIGQNQQWSVFSSSSDALEELRQENDRLAQELAVTSNELLEERRQRLVAEHLASTGDSELDGLRQVLAGYVARGIPEDRILMALRSLGTPLKCHKAEQRDIEVITPNSSGGDSNRVFLDGGLGLFVEGDSGEEANRKKPWFDPEKPVILRATYLGGEKIVQGILPLAVILPTDDWLIRIRLTRTGLNGYANVTVSKCLNE